jgi:PEP-CTERM motif
VWITRAKSVLSAVLLGAAATFGTVGSAQAAIYTGNWDPAYGGIFPQLGWSATATFDVPNGCLAVDVSNAPISGACAGFDVLSASVNFYDIDNPSTILESFSLDPDVIVTGISIAGGQLSGIDTGFFDYFVPTLSIAGGGQYSFSLVLYGGTFAQLVYADPQETSPSCALFPVNGASCGYSAEAANGTFTTAVPEPETYVLMLAGLVAVGLARRRRR